MDDIDRTETENEETGRLKNFNSWIKRNFNYECYMTFLNGCYGCNWEAKQEKKARRPLCCCSLVQRVRRGETDHTFFCLERSAIIVCVCVCVPTYIMCNGSKITLFRRLKVIRIG